MLSKAQAEATVMKQHFQLIQLWSGTYGHSESEGDTYLIQLLSILIDLRYARQPTLPNVVRSENAIVELLCLSTQKLFIFWHIG